MRELGQIYQSGCPCSERLRSKDGGESLTHYVERGNGIPMERQVDIRDEKFVSGRGECVCV